MRLPAAALLICALGACVPYTGPMPAEVRGPGITDAPFLPLDPGASQVESLHFRVRSYGSDKAQKISEVAEKAYARIMLDTNLYSFRPAGLYQIIVYANAEEYQAKTRQPSWSAGATLGNAICSYEGPGLVGTLVHEMSHLIYHEYMGRDREEERWVNEGLAVYEEAAAFSEASGGRDLFAQVRGAVAQSPMPFERLARFAPATEREYSVSAWYAQAESVVRHMIERGGRLGFSQFLAALKSGRSFDEAMTTGFPGNWRNMDELERDWRKSL